MLRRKILPLLSLAATLSVLTACQTTSTNRGDGRFEKADVNKDGKLSKTEFSDYFVTSIFESRDANHDQTLTWAEWKVEGVKGSKARFEAGDANKDGVVTLQEALARGRKAGVFGGAFTEADTNKDGFVTQAEAQAYYGSKEGSPY